MSRGSAIGTAGSLALAALLILASPVRVRASLAPASSTTSPACAVNGTSAESITLLGGGVDACEDFILLSDAGMLAAGVGQVAAQSGEQPAQPGSDGSPVGSPTTDTQGKIVFISTGTGSAVSQDLPSSSPSGSAAAPAAGFISGTVNPPVASPTTVVGDSPPAIASTRVAGKTVSSAFGAKKGTQVLATATCPTGSALLGGGGMVVTSDAQGQQRAVLSQSFASASATWTAVGVVGDSDLSNNQTLNVTAVAVCSQ